MGSAHVALIERRIVYAVKTLCSRERLGRAVIPFDVWSFGEEFGIYAVEATIRRHMASLAEDGRLVRVGERKGYLVPDWRSSPKTLTPDARRHGDSPSPNGRGEYSVRWDEMGMVG